MIDHTTAVHVHRCDLPRLIELGSRGRNGLPTILRPHPIGTRFRCDGCETVHVVHFSPGSRGRRAGYSPDGLAWGRETRRERRKRLGLRWWQR